jgi:hypothetical protein
MNQRETMLLVGFLPFYLAAFGLYHFMIVRVNQQLPVSERIPHHISVLAWKRLVGEYREFYPSSIIYPLTLSCAVTCVALALAFAGYRLWEYVTR